MLLEVPYKVGDTVSIKLTSGEEMVARLDDEKGDTIILKRPLMIAATQQGLGLAPFMFSVDPNTKIVINNSKVVCVAKTQEEFAKQYIENTTGIVT
jgi:small nuclear ribonucleoprotein (snRNP)-like protein